MSKPTNGDNIERAIANLYDTVADQGAATVQAIGKLTDEIASASVDIAAGLRVIVEAIGTLDATIREAAGFWEPIQKPIEGDST